MKSFFKAVLVSILGFQVRRLRVRHQFKIIGVVGSIGKTSTKLAIAKVLASKFRVRFEEGNYNDLVSVPLVIFGQRMPNIWNILAWALILIKNEIQILFKYPFDYLVLELGTDAPGQIIQFRKYLHLDIAILTAITLEHMEFFRDLNEVADEEWSVNFFANTVFVNRDLCKIVSNNIDHKKIVFYGQDFGSVYKIESIERGVGKFNFSINYTGEVFLKLTVNSVSEIMIYSVAVAAIIGAISGIAKEKIVQSVGAIKSFKGRMNLLRGVKNSTIIDDSYNASLEAVKIALDTLYNFSDGKSDRKIAILGMMNELGSISEEEHRKIGKYCDPEKLKFIVTIGRDANLFLAKSARENGCIVYEAKNAEDAGRIVLEKMEERSLILVKGSQNGVFAEEAVKVLLEDKNDIKNLVRQGDFWKKNKIHS